MYMCVCIVRFCASLSLCIQSVSMSNRMSVSAGVLVCLNLCLCVCVIISVAVHRAPFLECCYFITLRWKSHLTLF